jgi:alpha-L-rhamnosidase
MLSVVNPLSDYKTKPLGMDAAHPGFSWMLASDQKNVLQAAYQIQVSVNSHFAGELCWDTGKTYSGQSVHVPYQGSALNPCTRYFFRIRAWDGRDDESAWSETAFFETGIMDLSGWTADWITPPSGEFTPSPCLRSVFETAGKIRSARAYVTSLGLYELHINGCRIGDAYLTPGWTSYGKTLQYQTYDITPKLRDGKNAAGALLGPGWYAGNLAWENSRCLYGDRLALLCQIHIDYEDGRRQVVTSGKDWTTSSSPILFSEIYHGETYDAAQEKSGWDMPDYEDAGWEKVCVLEKDKSALVSQISEPVRKIEEIQPVGMIRTPAGETVIDFGQNMVGWVRFKVRGKRGDCVILKHAEVLDKDGNFYVDNLRKAMQTIEYRLKGTGEEVFEPHFTFQGFRYVKIESYPGTPKLADFIGIVVHTGMAPSGFFECSSPLVNQLQHNIRWGQNGNFVDIPTDCPQRDERLGWTGDAQAFIRTACFNMNTALFFKKWLNDVKNDQRADGGVPFVIPDALRGDSHSSSGWGDAAVICPWTVYLCYGDTRILADQYDSMKAWVEYIRGQGDHEYLWNTGFHFGDWLALDAKEGSYFGSTPNDLISTAFYAYSTDILAKTAVILGKTEDAALYEDLHAKILQAFRDEFITPSGRIASPTQTAHVLALMFGLVEEKDRKRTADTLVKDLTENKFHLKTGFLGTPYLCHVLSSTGHLDVAYKLLLQEDFPSWLYPVKMGATTIWEHWDGIKPDGSFWSANMNSFNHYAYGAIGDWLYQVVAGIETDDRPTGAGYKRILFKPQPGPGLEYAKASLQSLYGLISSEWLTEGGRMTVKVTVPCNTTAELVLPGMTPERLKIDFADCDYTCSELDGLVKVDLGSGSYEFKYQPCSDTSHQENGRNAIP